MVLVVLRLSDANNATLSENTYWQGRDEGSHQKLNTLATQTVSVNANATLVGTEYVISVRLNNAGKQAALSTKLTLVNGKGERLLPAYYSDNYLTLLPHEPEQLEIRYPARLGTSAVIKLRGWNVKSSVSKVGFSNNP
jgi:hypothetical protein